MPLSLNEKPSNNRRPRLAMSSGMLRLSCPHLVKALDEYEFKGNGIERMNNSLNERLHGLASDTTSVGYQERTGESESTSTVASGSSSANAPSISSTESIDQETNIPFSPASKALRAHFADINEHWRKLRLRLLSETDKEALRGFIGEEAAEHFMRSGICSISPEKVNDVKCLHIHVADTLMRGKGANVFGELALERLEKEYGVDANGCNGKYQVHCFHLVIFLPTFVPVLLYLRVFFLIL
jgi:hypothetical protein